MSELKDVSIKEGGGGGDTFDEIKQVVGAFSGDAVVLHIEKTPKAKIRKISSFGRPGRPGNEQNKKKQKPLVSNKYLGKGSFMLVQEGAVQEPKGTRWWCFKQVYLSFLFDMAILVVIAANILFMITGILKADEASSVIPVWTFPTLFTLELLVKLFCLGFVAKPFDTLDEVHFPGGYFRSMTNVMDFGVTVACWIGAYVSSMRLLRSLQLLRALHLLSMVKKRNASFRAILNTMSKSLFAVLNVFFFLGFLFLIYGIAGVHLFEGRLRQRCFHPSDTALTVPGAYCALPEQSGGVQCPSELVCVAGGWSSNPNGGLSSFDQLLWSLFTLFVTMTTDGWSSLMYTLQDTFSFHVWIYFLSWILLAAWFAMQLVLAIVSDQYTTEMQEIEKKDVVRQDLSSLVVEAEAAEKNVGRYENWLKKRPHDLSFRASQIQQRLDEARLIMANNNTGLIDVELRNPAYPPELATPKATPNPSGAAVHPAGGGSNGSLELLSVNASDSKASDANSLIIEQEMAREVRQSVAFASSKKVERQAAKMAAVGGGKDAAKKRISILENEAAGVELVQMTAEYEAQLAENEDLITARRVEAVVNSKFSRFEYYIELKPTCFRKLNHLAANSTVFYLLVLGTITGASVVLSLSAMPGNESSRGAAADAMLEYALMGLLGFMAFEVLIVKLFGLGPYTFFTSSMLNVLDFLVVAAAIASFVIPMVEDGEGINTVAAFLRLGLLLRAVRMFQVLGKIRMLKRIVGTLLRSIVSLGTMTVLLAVFILLFAVAGNELFPDPLSPEHRFGFQNIGQGSLTIFQVLTGDSWSTIMYTNIQEQGGWISYAFFFFVLIFGKYIVISIFISVLLYSFAGQTSTEEQYRSLVIKGLKMRRKGYRRIVTVRKLQRLIREQRVETTLKNQEQLHRIEEKEVAKANYKGISILQQIALRIVRFPVFDYFFLLVILFNCALLALDYPSNTPAMQDLVAQGEVICIILFTAELGLLLLAYGVIKGPMAYFRSGWRILDALVVVTSMVAYTVPKLAFLASLRAARPLRLIIRSKNMRLTLTSLLLSLPSIFSVFVFCALFWSMFGLMSVKLFQDQMWMCNDSSVTSKEDCVGTYSVLTAPEPATWNANDAARTVIVDREWTNSFYNFDTFGKAMLTLFQAASLNDWVVIMYQTTDITGVDSQPQRNNQPFLAIFWFFFVIICAFFTLNLFLGTLLDNFKRNKDNYEGSSYRTRAQVQWLNLEKLIVSCKLKPNLKTPKPLPNLPHYLAFKVVHFKFFDGLCMLSIVLNAIMLSLEGYDTGISSATLYTIGLGFVVFYSVEAAIKIMGYGPLVYFRNPLDVFDFCLVVLSLSAFFYADNVGALIALLRMLRILRLVELLTRAKLLNNVFTTLRLSLSSLLNVALLILLFFFMYAIVGVKMFGNTKKVPGGFDQHVNFDNVGMAMLSLFRLATFDAWASMHMGGTIEPPLCTEGKDCGAGGFASLYFIVFGVLGSMVFVNLYNAVIIDSYAESKMVGKEEGSDFNHALENISAVWTCYDRNATESLSCEAFMKVLSSCPPPMGFGSNLWPRIVYQRRLNELKFRLHKPNPWLYCLGSRRHYQVGFRDALRTLAKKVAHINVEDNATLQSVKDKGKGVVYLEQYYAAQTIQLYFRSWVAGGKQGKKSDGFNSESGVANKKKNGKARRGSTIGFQNAVVRSQTMVKNEDTTSTLTLDNVSGHGSPSARQSHSIIEPVKEGATKTRKTKQQAAPKGSLPNQPSQSNSEKQGSSKQAAKEAKEAKRAEEAKKKEETKAKKEEEKAKKEAKKKEEDKKKKEAEEANKKEETKAKKEAEKAKEKEAEEANKKEETKAKKEAEKAKEKEAEKANKKEEDMAKNKETKKVNKKKGGAKAQKQMGAGASQVAGNVESS